MRPNNGRWGKALHGREDQGLVTATTTEPFATKSSSRLVLGRKKRRKLTNTTLQCQCVPTSESTSLLDHRQPSKRRSFLEKAPLGQQREAHYSSCVGRVHFDGILSRALLRRSFNIISSCSNTDGGHFLGTGRAIGSECSPSPDAAFVISSSKVEHVSAGSLPKRPRFWDAAW